MPKHKPKTKRPTYNELVITIEQLKQENAKALFTNKQLSISNKQLGESADKYFKRYTELQDSNSKAIKAYENCAAELNDAKERIRQLNDDLIEARLIALNVYIKYTNVGDPTTK